jgi:hypothetical protein
VEEGGFWRKNLGSCACKTEDGAFSAGVQRTDSAYDDFRKDARDVFAFRIVQALYQVAMDGTTSKE